MKILIVGNCVPEEIITSKSKKVRLYLQKGYSYYLQPTIIVSELANCWKIADLVSKSLWANFKHRWKDVGDKINSLEEMKEKIEDEGHDIVVVVVNYKNGEEFIQLLRLLGIKGLKNLILVSKIDILKDIICFNQKKNYCKIF